VTERGALTLWRSQREGHVRTWKESDRATGTHFLETTEVGTHQATERKRPSDGHSLPGDRRGRDLLGYGEKVTKQRALTNWRPQKEGLVRARKEINQAMGTHSLETAEGGACQDMERRCPSDGHSLPGDRRGRDLSVHRKKLTKRWELTNWRSQRLVKTQKESD